jgi:predicted short-subunit dehydrogenase-like oxidoreductase (DUF2520 family)
MDIVIIGSGNVAAVLGRKFIAAGHKILQVLSRNASAASKLAYEWDTVSANYIIALNNNADVYIIAVPDDAIDEVIKDLKLPGKVVAHTAASVSKDVLKNVTQHYGVFYPLQSLRKEMTALPEVPIFIEASDDKSKKVLEQLAHSISQEKVAVAQGDERMKLHVAAVVVSNFTNYLYKLAQDYCKKEGIDFNSLLPLIEETGGRLKNISAAASQTGPAVRDDKETIEKHMSLLDNHPELKKVYAFMTESILAGK